MTAYDGTDMLSPHFSVAELACPCGCGFVPFPVLVVGLEKLREAGGNLPLIVNSGARCEDYNRMLRFCLRCQVNVKAFSCPHCNSRTVQRSAKNSYHMFGKAADIRPPRKHSTRWLARLAERYVWDFRDGGIGTYKGFVHVDTGRGPRRWIG